MASDYTAAERALILALKAHSERVVVGSESAGSPEAIEAGHNYVRAQVLEQIFATPAKNSPGAGDRVIELNGVHVAGDIPWAFAKRVPPLEFRNCVFEGRIDLHSAQVSHLLIHGGTLHWLDLSGATVLESVCFGGGLTVGGAISLKNAVIRGDLLCTQLELRAKDSEPGMIADGLRVGGAFLLGHGFRSKKCVQIRGASIRGNLDLSGARIYNKGGIALCADLSKVDGNVHLSGCRTLGGVSFKGVQVRGGVEATKARFGAGAEYALCFDGATIQGDLSLDEVAVRGKARMLGARIGGDLDCAKSQFKNPNGGLAFSAARIDVKSNVYLNGGFRAVGEVKFAGGHIGGSLLCTNACLRYNWDTPSEKIGPDDAEGRCVLNAERLGVDGDVFIENTIVDGYLNFRSAIVQRDISIRHIYLSQQPNGFIGEGARIAGELSWSEIVCNQLSRVQLAHASVGRLTHDLVSWPGEGSLYLRGLSYRDIGFPNDCNPVDWLKTVHPFDPQPYEQLALALRRSGYEEEAIAVGIAKHDARVRKARLRMLSRIKGRILGSTIRYGYGVQRMVLLGVLMWVLGMWLFGVGHESRVVVETEPRNATSRLEYPPFQAAMFSLDALLPVVDLHQEKYWLPSADRPCNFPVPKMTVESCGSALRIYLWVHILAGWTISTLIVAGLTGLVRKE